ncbi:hypothetical protein BH10PSE2_BH10PSE2_07610 [soil metagenome]
MRIPSKKNTLATLAAAGVKFDHVVDIGVQSHTPELIEACADARHFLFEPVSEYWASIEALYKDIDHIDFRAAASNKNESVGLHLVERDGAVTHAHVTENAERTIDAVRLDDALAPYPEVFGSSTLLKIDVDGHEMKVLEGGSRLVETVGCIIIEAPLATVPARLNFIVSLGLELWDIVDLSYWQQQLSQVDLVFLNRELREKIRGKPPQDSASLSDWWELTGWLASQTNSQGGTKSKKD